MRRPIESRLTWLFLGLARLLGAVAILLLLVWIIAISRASLIGGIVMKRFMSLILMASLTACAAMPLGTMHHTLVDGQSITYMTSPGTSPTVVFESGLGSNARVWADVYESVEGFAGVFAYSRPGYSAGFQRTDVGGKRTARDAARLLHQVLMKSGTPAPYILVGHSIGGLYTLEFARMYPELVAGLVLVDARLPGFTEQCIQADVGPCLPPASATLLAPPHVAAEIRGIRVSEAAAPGPADLGEIPTVLLAATEPPPGASRRAQPVWLAVQKDYADSLANGRLIIANGSGHFMQNDAPELVVEAIRSLMPIDAPHDHP